MLQEKSPFYYILNVFQVNFQNMILKNLNMSIFGINFMSHIPKTTIQ